MSRSTVPNRLVLDKVRCRLLRPQFEQRTPAIYSVVMSGVAPEVLEGTHNHRATSKTVVALLRIGATSSARPSNIGACSTAKSPPRYPP